ncbi:DUF2087 domain-containing protein [Streptococcus sp. zg-86]|uniref:DUF2087 domain-containing protein n=1 Tax=Streptococcus zhangguiae TaxID=2664091 RepID=A0A6I4RCN4_9STRE|nr:MULTISPECIES: DUF2087 domain-containing protein [Streptococcus]MTB64541.1 DUF2087 domain-containing protein [Streptococcus sp. zg-86]MTB90769.1 DUF2087 domain-containing protein [Streptococcus sp. zg-36]MWV56528.1 DUF2087 domain-containing protein [Streptococcus sp. zg-70]QTH47266.1 DUF2087 domain-containing protein [Streptococcus sp. zg-86]
MDQATIQQKYFRQGRLVTIPKKEQAKWQLFHYFQQQLAEQGQQFTEKEINDFFKTYYDDTAILRRYLVDYGFLERDLYGKIYTIGERNGYLDER